MAKNWEPIFISWTKPPSDTEETKCENAVRMIRDAINAYPDLSKYTIEVFAQGSYPNNTNVRLNSDVDVCVRNMSVFLADYPEGKFHSDFGNIFVDYQFSTFRAQVHEALNRQFGAQDIKPGKKALDIAGNRYRIEADVVPCFEHRRYPGYRDVQGNFTYLSGIEFITTEGTRIISWPKQHLENGISKNRETGTTFKKVVRIFRRLNYAMQEAGIQAANPISGYLLECLCWNVENMAFNSTVYTDIVRNIIIFLYNKTQDPRNVDEWGEISELMYLFRGNNRWTLQDVNNWTRAAWNYLEFGS